eukprot:CAMPEP_0184872276 /NCGR_PEP_ID=MMETSP0580-20130426/41193_1 /TAXON_ID=1118495 /ORGANISM="Dactyliosolen fragilissimus" /LENGTH=173 /DNA_ID=CAMNT_0027375045 /DNA_START=1324 /DNA_END=1845 /DNA_ORIENTATION=+
MNGLGCTIRFTEENVCHELLRQVMKKNLKDPYAITSGQILDCVQEAQDKSSYPRWDPQRHYLVTILTFLKKIFYMKNFGDDDVANPEALELSKNKKEEYKKKIDSCVKQSQRSVYMNDLGCTIRFTEENVCHELLRQVMKKNLKDPHAITSGQILDCVQEAQDRAASGKGMNA